MSILALFVFTEYLQQEYCEFPSENGWVFGAFPVESALDKSSSHCLFREIHCGVIGSQGGKSMIEVANDAGVWLTNGAGSLTESTAVLLLLNISSSTIQIPC